MQVCNTACSSPGAETCRPLKSLSVGAKDVTTYPESISDACGPTWDAANLGTLASQAPSDPEHCEAFYLTSSKVGAKVSDICEGGDCPVQFVLDNGVTAVTGAKSASPSPGTSAAPSPPGPQPYGRRRSLQQEPVTTSYGRRRSLQQEPVTTSYGRRRSLQQEPVTTSYGRRRSLQQEPVTTSYGRRF